MLRNKFVKNLSWIFFGNIAHAFFQFVMSIVAARMLTTESFGTINYSASLITFFTAVGTLGFNHVLTKYYAEKEASAGVYTGTAILARLVTAILSIAIIQIIVRITDPGNVLLYIIVLCQSITVLFGAFDSFVYWFRYKNQAKVVAIVRLVAFVASAIFRLWILLTTIDIIWYVVACSSETLMFSTFLLIEYIKRRNQRLSFSKDVFFRMLKLSHPFILSALLSTIYGQTDKIMLKQLMSTDSVAYYSVSLTLAGAISIIPIALIDGFRPEIMKYKISDTKLYAKRLRQLYSVVFWICIAYGIFVSFFSRAIILIAYGKKYLPAATSLATIVWYTSFSYFGSINNIYMVCENKTVFVQITTFVGAVLNVGLNFALIPVFGVEGAAVASLTTQIIINFLVPAIIPCLRPCFRAMVEGIAFRDTFALKWRKNNEHTQFHK